MLNPALTIRSIAQKLEITVKGCAAVNNISGEKDSARLVRDSRLRRRAYQM